MAMARGSGTLRIRRGAGQKSCIASLLYPVSGSRYRTRMRPMSLRLFPSLSVCLLALGVAVSATQPSAPRQLRIIAFGAHPDDAELKAAGVASLWAAQGHKVKFVAATNGDIGHFSQAGGPLAQRRYKEVQECARIMGITTDVLNRLFSNDFGPLRQIRDIGLGIVDRMPRLKEFFIRQASGLTGDTPRLLKGEAI